MIQLVLIKLFITNEIITAYLTIWLWIQLNGMLKLFRGLILRILWIYTQSLRVTPSTWRGRTGGSGRWSSVSSTTQGPSPTVFKASSTRTETYNKTSSLTLWPDPPTILFRSSPTFRYNVAHTRNNMLSSQVGYMV